LRVGLTNTGMVEVVSGELRQDSGTTTTNQGQLVTDAGASPGFTLTSGSDVFVNDSGGSVANGGAMSMSAGSWSESGGSESGNPVVLSGGAFADAGSGSSGEFDVLGAVDVSGTIAVGETLRVLGQSGDAVVTLTAASTNDGTVVLDSESAGYAMLQGDALTNDGTLESQLGSGSSPDYLRVGLVNASGGSVTVESGELLQDSATTTTNDGDLILAPSGAFDLGGGSAVLDQQSDGTITFDIAGASSYGVLNNSGPGTFNLNGGTVDPVLEGGYAPPVGSSFGVITGPISGGGAFTTVDNNFLYAGGTLTRDRDSTSASVTSAVNPSTYGQAVRLTATVVAGPNGVAQPTGKVTFFDDGTQIGTGSVSTAGGASTATLTTSTLAGGKHPITVSYGGDGNYKPSPTSSLAVDQVVNQLRTSTSVKSSLDPAMSGQPITLTATVTPASRGPASPAGTVTFFDNGTQIGTGSLSTTGAITTATFTTSALTAGTHPITASYDGDGNYQPSARSSPPLDQVVDAPQNTLKISLSGRGSGTVGGESIHCPSTCSASYPAGTLVVLTGTAAAGSTFAGWSGAGCVGTEPCTVTMSADQAVTATFIDAPPPVLRQSSDLAIVSGTIRIRLPHSHRFETLTRAQRIPLGTLVDATHGTVLVVLAQRGGGTLVGQYWKGEFVLSQSASGAVTAKLQGGDLAACVRPSSRKGPLALTARHRGHRRQLWSSVHGDFTTRGQWAAGTVRGTEWLTVDSCQGTTIRVVRDTVQVTNLRTHRSVLVHAGHSAFVSAPR
jgi:hypothetical protein